MGVAQSVVAVAVMLDLAKDGGVVVAEGLASTAIQMSKLSSRPRLKTRQRTASQPCTSNSIRSSLQVRTGVSGSLSYPSPP